MATKYIFVIGGVMSGIGKGVSTSSIGTLLQARGFTVGAVKIDPYLNVDAGTMNPVEHGEVFVTEDGTETDQDIGNYERFLQTNGSAAHYMTSGSVYLSVITRERNLGYGGRCVEVVPDIPEEVIRRLQRAARASKADFLLVEIGGTVGEYQNLLFLEAARVMRLRHPGDVLFTLVSYLPIPSIIGEMKTKPTQYAVRTLNSAGIQPDIIIARSEKPIDEPRKKKISIFCNTEPADIISAPDIATSIYEVPETFEQEGIARRILKKFSMRDRQAHIQPWQSLVRTITREKPPVKIGVVGKYFGSGDFVLEDSYISVLEAIKHASWKHGRHPLIQWIDAEAYERSPRAIANLKQFDGIIVPGGFGARGAEGKIRAIRYCREEGIPFLGLCYGMQLAAVEYARNRAGLRGAHTTEVNRGARHPVIDIMEEQRKNVAQKDYGASMRLGSYTCDLRPGTRAYKAYKNSSFPAHALKSALRISERHRHRYEFNNAYKTALEDKGLVFSGTNSEHGLVEILELSAHPFFIATQFHPEFTSRPLRPHPLFLAFIKAALG